MAICQLPWTLGHVNLPAGIVCVVFCENAMIPVSPRATVMLAFASMVLSIAIALF